MVAKATTWDVCPICGGEVTASADAYLAHIQQVNDDHPDIESGSDVTGGITVPAEAPTGGVGICSQCGNAVAASGSEDAALTEPPADVQMPAESPEHMDTATGSTETPVHEVDPDAVPEPAS